MRTALVLLILLAAGAAVGSLLPQIPNSPQRVASYQLAHPFFGSLFLRAGFFDVFGSWWFVLILTLLFVSLIACLIPRSRTMIRTIRQRPIQAREIDAFRQSGAPMDFTSKVELFNPDGSLGRTDSVTINHPVSFDGVRIFQFGFGWAPVVTIAYRGVAIFQGPVVMGQNAQPGDNPLTVPWIGFVKLPTLRPQVAIKLELYPDSVAYFAGLIAGVPQPMTQAKDPFMRYSLWKGKLLDPSLSGLDTRFMHQVATGGIGQGWTVDLARGCVASGTSTAGLPRQLAGTVCPSGRGSGLTMSFPHLRQYSRLQISRDTTVPWVLGAAILILAGLVAAMYSSRRKVWVRAERKDAGSVVQIGGFALQRKDRFEEAFPKLVEDLNAAFARIPADRREEVGAR